MIQLITWYHSKTRFKIWHNLEHKIPNQEMGCQVVNFTCCRDESPWLGKENKVEEQREREKKSLLCGRSASKAYYKYYKQILVWWMLLPKGTGFLCERDVFGEKKLSIVYWWGIVLEWKWGQYWKHKWIHTSVHERTCSHVSTFFVVVCVSQCLYQLQARCQCH